MGDNNSSISDAPEVSALRVELQRLAALLQDAVTKVNSADALRIEAERKLQNALGWLKAAEAQVANREALLTDAQRLAMEREREIIGLQATLQLRAESGEILHAVMNGPDTPLEALLNEYGLFDLAALVKARRCADESRGHSSVDAEMTS